jgi:2OG-Fe(II) oxygenase superfamily
MEREILEEKVYYYTNVIQDPQKLVEAIDKDNQDPWGEWMACSGQHYVYGTDKTIYTPENDDEKNNYIYNTIRDAFDVVAKDYASAQGIIDAPKLFPMYPIKRYEPGTFMGAHFDQQEGDERLKVSFVMYLNDDYEGGELSFTIGSPDGVLSGPGPNPDFAQAEIDGHYTFAIKPKAGSIIVFPPSPPYHHTAHLVKSGMKYMVPNHWIS